MVLTSKITASTDAARRPMGMGREVGGRGGDPILAFRAEKRSAQTSAHPLLQAQGGLFCLLTVFVCCWSSE